MVAESREEADKCAAAHWDEEWREGGGDFDSYLSVGKPETGPVKDPDWANSIPYGRSFFRGKQYNVNEIIALMADPPALETGQEARLYDTATMLMPFVDSPPPLREEESE